MLKILKKKYFYRQTDKKNDKKHHFKNFVSIEQIFLIFTQN